MNNIHVNYVPIVHFDCYNCGSHCSCPVTDKAEFKYIHVMHDKVVTCDFCGEQAYLDRPYIYDACDN